VVHINELLELKSDASDIMFEQVYLFHKALDLFEKRSWKDAENAFSQVLKLSPNDGPSLLYLERCRQFQDYPPEAGWDGIFDLTEK
jgi:adenylate cyclase